MGQYFTVGRKIRIIILNIQHLSFSLIFDVCLTMYSFKYISIWPLE